MPFDSKYWCDLAGVTYDPENKGRAPYPGEPGYEKFMEDLRNKNKDDKRGRRGYTASQCWDVFNRFAAECPKPTYAAYDEWRTNQEDSETIPTAQTIRNVLGQWPGHVAPAQMTYTKKIPENVVREAFAAFEAEVGKDKSFEPAYRKWSKEAPGRPSSTVVRRVFNGWPGARMARYVPERAK